ncbi:four-carbon acid sugar kinase family protein [Aestuariivivens insulae]|uniref:four-carbon acid sugar kinase family protein n=1 Tax=Aestuariivivens insulae TaxID=1621988 RepID=UPI001F58DF27|nr:four-carbon acid sugar kinase family protein [Aestuariivivens insulae]
MSLFLKDILGQLPKEDTYNYRDSNKILFNTSNKTCVIIDDDPTGNQTVYDVPILTQWDLNTLIHEFKKETRTFFILTNSRSLSKEKSSAIYKEISKNILKASQLTLRDYTIVSRSDSTLRGHFSEIEAIKQSGDFNKAITVFAPVMFEGGRVTISDIHYINENQKLVPVNKTAFSKDHTFAYMNADLKYYIEEKTNGKTKAPNVVSISIETIRTMDVNALCTLISAIAPGKYCIINAVSYSDLDKVAQALLLAEKSGKKILYRTSSSFAPSYIGLTPKPLLDTEQLIDPKNKNGGLTIVGSYVPKSSSQLKHVFENNNQITTIVVDVEIVLGPRSTAYLESIISNINKTTESGRDAIVYTSRKLITGNNAKTNIDIATKISQALVTMVNGIKVCPKYILAKGGITSHDLAIKGLYMNRSKVLGQILPGVPVWEMGMETRFPKLLYIVFPGNIGDEKSLSEIIKKLS